MDVGFAAALGVDLDLTADDAEPCMLDECSKEAVWAGIISTPCRHDQPLCLAHYTRELPRWAPGDEIFCYYAGCRPKTISDTGEFIRWERLKK